MRRITSSHLVDSIDTLISMETSSNDVSIGDSLPSSYDHSIGHKSRSKAESLSMRSLESYDVSKEQFEEEMIFFVYMDDVLLQKASSKDKAHILFLKDQFMSLGSVNISTTSIDSSEYDYIEMKQLDWNPNIWRGKVSKKLKDLQFHYRYKIGKSVEGKLRLGDLEQNDIFDIFNLQNLTTGFSVRTTACNILHNFLQAIFIPWCAARSDEYQDSLYYLLRSFQALMQSSLQWSVSREGIQYNSDSISETVLLSFHYVIDNLDNQPKNAFAATALLGYLQSYDGVTIEDIRNLLMVLKSSKALSFQLKEEVSSSIRHIEWITKGFRLLCNHPDISVSDQYLWLGSTYILKLLDAEDGFLLHHLSISDQNYKFLGKSFSLTIDELCRDGALSGHQKKGSSRIRHVFEALLRNAPSYEGIAYFIIKNQNLRILNSQNCISALKERLENLDNIPFEVENIEFEKIFKMLDYCKCITSFEDIVCIFLKSNIFKRADSSFSIRLLTFIEECNTSTRMSTPHNFNAIREWTNYFLNYSNATFSECLRTIDSVLRFTFLKDHQVTFVEEILSCKHLVDLQSDSERLYQLIRYFDPTYCEVLISELFQKRCQHIIRHSEGDVFKLADLYASVCAGCGDRPFSESQLWRIVCSANCTANEFSVLANPVWASILCSNRRFFSSKLQELHKEGIKVVKRICISISTNKVSLQTFRLILDNTESFKQIVDNIEKSGAGKYLSSLERLKDKFNTVQQKLDHYHVVMTNFCSNFNLRFSGDIEMKQILSRRFDSPDTLALDEAEFVVSQFFCIISDIDAKWMYNLRSSEIFLHIWKCEADKFSSDMNIDSQLYHVLHNVKEKWNQIFLKIDSVQILKSQIEPIFERLTAEKYFIELEKLFMYRTPEFNVTSIKKFETAQRIWIKERESYLFHLQKRRQYSEFVNYVLQLLDHLSTKIPHLTSDSSYKILSKLKDERETIYDCDFILKESGNFEGYPFYTLSSLQMQFFTVILSQKSILKWLSNHPSDSDFGNLISICKQFDDDAKVREALESLSLIRSLLHDILYSDSLSNVHVLEHKASSLNICPKYIQEAKSLVKDFPLLLTVFRERTLSQGIQSIHMLRTLMKSGQYKVGNDIYCSNVNSSENHTWDMNNLLDLRSKLMLAEIPQEIQEFEAHITLFVRQIPFLLDLRKLHRYLFNQGHFQFSDPEFYQTFPANTSLAVLSKKVENLQSLKLHWKGIVREARQKIYSLNFFPMRQLATIPHLLFNAVDDQDAKFSQLLGLLNYVEDGLSPSSLKEIIEKEWYSKEKWEKLSPDNKLYSLGEFLDRTFKQTATRQGRRQQNQRSWNLDRNMRTLHKEMQEEPYNNIQFWEKAKAYHFCIVSKDTYKEVLDSIITIYASEKRIPKPDEVFICDEQSIIEDIILIINRWYYSHQYGRSSSIYCIANIHFLSYSTQARIFVHLNQLLRSCKEENRINMATLVLLNASKQDIGLESQHLLTALSPYVVNFSELNHSHIIRIYQWIVSQQNKQSQISRAVCYWSMYPGGGKTHTILKIVQQRGGVYKRISIDNTNTEDLVRILTHDEDNFRHFHFLIGQESRVKDDILLFQMLYIGALRSSNMIYSFSSHPSDYFYIELAGRSVSSQTESPYSSMAVIPRLPHLMIPKPNSSKCHLEFEVYKYSSNNGVLSFRFVSENELKMVCQFLMNFRSNEHGSSFAISRKQCIEILSYFLKEYTFTGEEMSSFVKIYTFVRVLGDLLQNRMVTSMSKDQQEWLIHSAADFACQYIHFPEYGSSDYKQRFQGILKWHDLLPHKRFVIFDKSRQFTDFISYTPDALHLKSGRDLKISEKFQRLQSCKDISHEILQPLLCQIFNQSPQPITNTTFAISDGHAAMILHLTYRLRYNIPCILIAETGSGKSESIRYIASVLGIEMQKFSLHGGHHPHDISSWLTPLIQKAEASPQIPIFIFMDQLNSASCMTFLKEIVCDRMLNNLPLPPNLKIIAAANPHRELRYSDFDPMMPNSCLVYQVKQLPEALLQHVLDFGKLTEGREELYIQSIILYELNINQKSKIAIQFAKNFASLIEFAQRFTRWTSGDESSVSLRDVKRCIKLYNWFALQFCKKNKLSVKTLDELISTANLQSIVGKSAVLSIAHCYYYRLSQDSRKLFEDRITSLMENTPTTFQDCSFLATILEEQNYYASMMEIPNGISLNNALRENIFAILVSIMNYIPCFIIGKSGSSKSLAMEVIKHNLGLKGVLKGNSSVPLPAIELFVYSCSRISTPEGLIQTFNAARRYKGSNLESDTITVVLLNEVGLLEQSSHFPLKALYRELNEHDSQIAIIGLSNFQFDPSVSNRTIVVNRTPPDEKDLSLVVRGIVDSRHLDNNLALLAKGYQAVYRSQKAWKIRDDFFGLRDLYALVKYINTRLKDQLDAPLLSAAVHRNFGGVPRCLPDILRSFFVAVGFGAEEIYQYSAMSVLDRIKDNILDTSARNLMLISENNASLHHLFDQKILKLKDTEIIFGNGLLENSSKDDTHIVMTIQKIKVCMAEGRTVVLVGCEDLYNSLYDLFNMQYTEIYGKRFVSLALGTYSKMCLVHQNFRAIVIVEKKHANSSLAIALLNRFEKQSFDDSDLIVTDKARELVSKLESWMIYFKKGCEIQSDSKAIVKTHAFAGLHPNIINSLVVHLFLLHGSEEISSLFKRGVRKLLNIATADAVVRSKRRLGSTYFDIYFKEQSHVSLRNLLEILDLKHYHTANVLTYSPASIDIAFVLSQAGCADNVMYSYLHKMESEFEVQSCLLKFFDSNFRKIIFQCDLSVVTQQKIQQVRLIGDRLRLEEPSRRHKMIIFLIHIHPFQQSRYYVHFSGNEKNIFLDEIQSTHPELTELLIEPLTSYVEHINIRSIILSSFRTSLSQLGYSASEMNIPKKINILSFLLQQDIFWDLLQPKIKFLISQHFSKRNPTYWSEYVAMKVGTFFESGNYSQSLISHVTQMIIFSFSYILAQTDIDWNMEILFDFLKNPSKTSALGIQIWSEGWKNLTFPPHHYLSLSNMDFSEWPDTLMKVHSSGIESKFPFSFIYCKTLHDIRAVCEHSRTSLSEVLKTYILFALPHLSDLPQELSLAYLHDYLGSYGFETIHVSKSNQLQIITFLLKAFKPTFSGIADVQEFLWTQEPRLHTYFSALECIPGAAQHFIQQLSKPLFLFSVQQCDILLLETLLEGLYPPQRIAVSEIYQFSEDEWIDRLSAVTIPILQLLSIVEDPKLQKNFEVRFRRYLLHKLYLKEVKEYGHSFWSMIKNEDTQSSSCTSRVIRWGIELILHGRLKNVVITSLSRFLEFYCRDIEIDESILSYLTELYKKQENDFMPSFPSASLMISLIRNKIQNEKNSFIRIELEKEVKSLQSSKYTVENILHTKHKAHPSILHLYVEAYKLQFSSWDLSRLARTLEETYSPQIQKLKNHKADVKEIVIALGIIKVYISKVEELLYSSSIYEEETMTLEVKRFLETSIQIGIDIGNDFLMESLLQETIQKRGYSAVVEVVLSQFAKHLGWPYIRQLEKFKDKVAPYRILLEKAKFENKEVKGFIDCVLKRQSKVELRWKPKMNEVFNAIGSLPFYFKSKSLRKDNIICCISHICALCLDTCQYDPLFQVLLWDQDRIPSCFIPGQEGFEEKLRIEGNYCHGISFLENHPVLKDAFYSVRNLSPITTRIIHIWTHSLMMVGKIIKKSHVKDIYTEAEQINWQWDALTKIFSGDEERATFVMYNVCSRYIPNIETSHGKRPFASYTLCDHWEKYMEKHIRSKSIQDSILSTSIEKEFESNPNIKESKTIIKSLIQNANCIPMQNQVTFDRFKFRLLNEGEEGKYPVLRYFVLHYTQLGLTRYIPSIQKWIDTLDKTLNRKTEKGYTKEHTIEEFIDNFEQSSQHELRTIFSHFMEAYNSIFVKEISENSSLYDCIRNQRRLMEDLVQKHNTLIQQKQKKNLSISISSRFATQYHLNIFDFEKDIFPALNLYSTLDTIEEYFCEKYIDGKPLIEVNVPDFIFLENSTEIKYRTQLGSHLTKVIPQVPLDNKLFNKVMESFEDAESKLNLHQVLQEIEQMILIIEAIARTTSSIPHASDTKIGYVARNFLLLDDNSVLLKYPLICEIPLQNLINLFDSLHVVKNS